MTIPRSPTRTAAALVLSLALVAGACRLDRADPPLTDADRTAISDTLRALLVNAYDLKQPDPLPRLLALYADSGRLVSASGGGVFATRDSVFQGVKDFWTYVGRNMREPDWQWGPMLVDVLSRDAAVLTTTYNVPHRTPDGRPHVVAGAWTAVFVRRGGKWGIVQEHLSEPQFAPSAPADSAAPADSGGHRH